MNVAPSIPPLEPRFLEPPGWHWGKFERSGRKLRFGWVLPEGKKPDAIVVCLTGLSEYIEKYFETARTVTSMNCAFTIMDWMGQGRSGRYLSNPHKRHSLGFHHDVDDLHEFIQGHVIPSNSKIPLALLAHSMGGNIGLHYLHRRPGVFSCAAFSVPLCAIKALSIIPAPLASLLANSLNFFASESYVGGDGDWREEMREIQGHDPFSSDPVRRKIHNAWCLADPRLQVGRVTYGWVHHALQSCLKLQNDLKEKPLTTPTLLALAGDEAFVDNDAARRIAGFSKTFRILELPDSRHEILMEIDAVRTEFFKALNELIRKT